MIEKFKDFINENFYPECTDKNLNLALDELDSKYKLLILHGEAIYQFSVMKEFLNKRQVKFVQLGYKNYEFEKTYKQPNSGYFMTELYNMTKEKLNYIIANLYPSNKLIILQNKDSLVSREEYPNEIHMMF